MLVALIIVLVILGSILFHFWTPWWWTEVASNWGNIDGTIILTFWVTGAVFVAVCLFMAYCVWRFNYREDRKADYSPENPRLEWILTILTTIGVCALLAPGLIVWNKYVSVPDEAVNIEVMGQQWYWNYRLPGEDGILGLTDLRNITDENPFGINFDDPNGLDDILVQADDLHILINQPIKMNLRSIDVLHDFYIPQFRAKMDMVPGMVTYYWFEPIRTGNFEILCMEYCGTGHYAMKGRVLVDEQSDYDEWLSEQMTFEEMMASLDKTDLIQLALNNKGEN
ncbi:MAG: Alternative cytochrome c oxidase subunit 2 [Alphaproteobacteria bacterium MarineAlpha5_Bin6]|nr:MAG: Alternative cytochrome c oxidase subunit 2 [Alphaproteobacteria bacterium MarineAlpha5_Bin6]|tara:strand:- start:2801 stop:3646 length:846 start_codon:yes stop_codon:yes gene_type:complete